MMLPMIFDISSQALVASWALACDINRAHAKSRSGVSAWLSNISCNVCNMPLESGGGAVEAALLVAFLCLTVEVCNKGIIRANSAWSTGT